jgi:Cys-tRNA synthase (O-phospho-L-seryl-tRNA:Cys-tRNA synthase)
MIPQVALYSRETIPSQLTAFTPPSDEEVELFGTESSEGIFPQIERVARGFAKRRFRGMDVAFVEECIAEGNFTVVELIWTGLIELKAKYPDVEERFKFYRMSVGYKLKEYWSLRATSTESYLRKKGIELHRHQLHESDAIRYYSEADEYVAMEHAVRDELELRVVEFYAMGNTRDLIAQKCGISERRVKKILIRIKKRLK